MTESVGSFWRHRDRHVPLITRIAFQFCKAKKKLKLKQRNV